MTKSFLFTAFFLCSFSLQAIAQTPPPPPDEHGGHHHQPPQVAFTACKGLTKGATCTFSGRENKTITGTCDTPPNSTTLACRPTLPGNRPPMGQKPPHN